MKTSLRKLAILGLTICCLGAGTKAMAVPTLQLDVYGGWYNPKTTGVDYDSTHDAETIIASGDSFTLYAYLVQNSSNSLDDTYYISAALTPKVSSSADLGAFTFNGTTVNATTDMTYGVPPLDAVATQLHDAGDLADHGIFDTYYRQFEFKFSATNVSQRYDTQYVTGQGPTAYESGDKMYYMAFNVDTSALDTDYIVHFDLYNTKLCINARGNCDGSGDVDITQFAPFSHDAESGRVPEPSTILLLGSGLVGLGLFGRRRKV